MLVTVASQFNRIQTAGPGWFGFLVVLFVGFYLYKNFSSGTDFIQEDESRFNFKPEFLLLTAYVLKVDGDVKERELKFVYWFLEKEYGEANLAMNKKILARYLSKNISIRPALKKIDYQQDIPTKIQLLNYLVKIATIDGFLTNKELEALTLICRGIDLRGTQLRSILAMQSFITEKDQQQKKQYKKQTEYTSQSRLRSAYIILGIDSKASVREIKGAYRKLVILYHPDKSMHLSEQFQTEAKDKYQQVNDAYDLLKDKLNFK